jgi:hypothetical protein
MQSLHQWQEVENKKTALLPSAALRCCSLGIRLGSVAVMADAFEVAVIVSAALCLGLYVVHCIKRCHSPFALTWLA